MTAHKFKFKSVSALLCVVTLLMPISTAYANLSGIDVSSHQSADVTERVAGDFAIVKATQGTGYTNPKMSAQLAGAERSGKLIGAYHYAGGGNPESEAAYFLGTVKPYIGRAVLILDWEEYQNAAWGDGTWATRFVAYIKSHTNGVIPMVYTQASALGQVQGARNLNAGLWVAQYANDTATGYQSSPWRIGAYGEAMRQYTSHGWLDGYYACLDLNLFRGDRTAWMKYANPNGNAQAAPSQPTPAAPSQASRVFWHTVQRGDTLSSIAARYGTSWRNITGYRSGNPNVIYVGETLRVGGGVQSTRRTYVVQRGDTLSSIAARYGTSWRNITGYRSGNPNVIYIGETLTIN